ncbi:helix-turn-helix domain-containing protein [Dellaglioa algida]|uniref:Insertion element IS150 protein InsJ-like helix-turn-helix domain-containing protein n=1 Tax=Dellaglioa algida TaxID=105612 RepID=A0A5C6MG57_9LACO|nr:helix-turn-helix domain-containing protein [Dellaglioa algida]MDK1716117.1 helix-turn-helix domain containing protein [Dellaglioa algida]MDK1719398.1 helix-turn-helix domain containing protein [Dellaglioa algida]MDK1721100.1 helix-turn-helix domain containing protein [Dellaglioa algida]MDK1722741.1 helix-turn-helix domain containing protein [Dellaglioa algida]MDK1724360.1 helix-turn-helix domain containing protein [Dellaglioa algida]
MVRYYKTHGVGYNIIAANFNIHPSQAQTWNKSFDLYGSQALIPRPKGRPTLTQENDKKKDNMTLTEKQKYEERILQLEAKLHGAELNRDFLKKLHALRSGKQIGRKP